MGVRTIKKKIMNCKSDALVFGAVRPIEVPLLVEGALFCGGLMNGRAQTVDVSILRYVIEDNSVYHYRLR